MLGKAVSGQDDLRLYQLTVLMFFVLLWFAWQCPSMRYEPVVCNGRRGSSQVALPLRITVPVRSEWFGEISEHKLNSIAMVMLMAMQIALLMAIHPWAVAMLCGTLMPLTIMPFSLWPVAQKVIQLLHWEQCGFFQTMKMLTRRLNLCQGSKYCMW